MRVHFRGLLAIPLWIAAGAAAACDGDAAGQAAVEAATRAWAAAYVAGDADALAALATADVILLDPDAAPVIGREAALAAWRRAAATTQEDPSIVSKEIVTACGFAWQIGATRRTGGGWSQFLVIWKRDDGRWKVHRRMSSRDSQAPLPAPRPLPSAPVPDQPGARAPPPDGGRN